MVKYDEWMKKGCLEKLLNDVHLEEEEEEEEEKEKGKTSEFMNVGINRNEREGN